MPRHTPIIPTRPLVVGSIASIGDISKIEPDLIYKQCDIIEIRLDGMCGELDELSQKLESIPEVPLLLTARRVDQGGLVKLDSSQRSKLLLKFIDFASWVDIELASLQEMSEVLHNINEQGVGLILSHHNFEKTPSVEEIFDHIEHAKEHRAHIVKLAFNHTKIEDIIPCIHALRNSSFPLSLMGMGKCALASRILYAQHGSVLNYGYLADKPLAPGQCPAFLLKQAIQSVIGEAT